VSTDAISRRYAKALMQLAAAHGAIEQYYSELTAFSSAVAGSVELSDILAAPGFRIEGKREIVREMASRLNISKTVGDFLLFLLDRKRFESLSSIIACYRNLADDAAGLLRSSVTSALPLTEAQADGIRNALEKATGKKIILRVEEDSDLIGGVVTRIGDMVYDGSIRTQLTKIQDILQEG
jgi:F-type H+-transporting ATPase subunit delta